MTELVDRGWSVQVLTSAPSTSSPSVEVGPSGERILFVTGPESGGTGVRRLAMVAKFALLAWWSGRRLSFDVVISDPPPTAGLTARLLSKQRRVPCIYYMADSWAGASQGASGLAGRAHGLIKRLEDKVLSGADAVIAATAGMAAIASKAESAQVHTILNGVPTDVFSPTGAVWDERPHADRPYFLYAGNAGVVHGAHIFAEAADRLWRDGCVFDIVYMGYGTETGRVADLKLAWPDRIHLAGNQPAETVAAAYRGAIGALSSLLPVSQYVDARPIKSLTGLAAGCPAIYAGDGNFAEILKENDLGYVTSYDVDGAAESLASALALHAEDTQGETNLRRRCADFARDHFDVRSTAYAASNVVEDLATGATS